MPTLSFPTLGRPVPGRQSVSRLIAFMFLSSLFDFVVPSADQIRLYRHIRSIRVNFPLRHTFTEDAATRPPYNAYAYPFEYRQRLERHLDRMISLRNTTFLP